MFTNIFLRRYNIIMSVFTILFVIYMAFMNFYILNLGKSFAEEYGAESYETTYITDFDIPEYSNDGKTRYSYIPSRFAFYNEEGENLIVSKMLVSEYHDLNKTVLVLEDTYVTVGSLLFVLSAFGLLLCARNRYTVTGYILLVIITLLISMRSGVLNYFAFILIIVGIISSYIIYKTRFVDWNENIFLSFGKSKNDKLKDKNEQYLI